MPADGESALAAALGITARQYQALLAIADGTTSRTAAARLGITEQTLNTHLRDAYRTLGVHSRVAALNRLRDHGLLAP